MSVFSTLPGHFALVPKSRERPSPSAVPTTGQPEFRSTKPVLEILWIIGVESLYILIK
jgi:hypothetical protein